MISTWLERRRLIRKGLACDKTRLCPHANWGSRLDTNWSARLVLLTVFVVLLHFGFTWDRPGR